MNPDDETTGQDEQQDDLEPDYSDMSTLESWPKLDVHVSQVLEEGATDEFARSRLALTDEDRAAHLAKGNALRERSQFVSDTGLVGDEDLEALKATGRNDANVIAQEFLRRQVEEREAEAAAAREAARTDEERELEAAAEARDAELQAREDALQALADQTAEALVEPKKPPVQVNMFSDSEDGSRMTTVTTTGEGGEVESHVGLGPAVRSEPAYRKASRERTGLFHVKDLADEVTSLPPGARAGFWAARSQTEKDALSRAFGIRPAVTGKELQALEGGA